MLKSSKIILFSLVFLLFIPFGMAESSWMKAGFDKSSRLSLHFDSIESRAQKRRYVGSAAKLGLSGLLGVGAVLSSKMDESQSLKKITGISLAVGSGILGFSGILSLVSPSVFEALPLKFQSMTQQDSKQLQAKIIAGEIYLQRLSKKEKTQSLIHAAGYGFLGTSQLVGYFLSQNKKNNSWLFYQGALLSGMGFFQLIKKDFVSAELKAYQKGLLLSASLFFN